MSALVWTESPLCSGEMKDCAKWTAPHPHPILEEWCIEPYVHHNRLWFCLEPEGTLHSTAEEAKSHAQRLTDEILRG